MEELIIEYLELFFAAYLIKFLFMRFISEIPYLKKYYYIREILPGVRNWDNRLKMIYYSEIFSISQSLFLALLAMLFHYFLSLNEYIEIIIVFLVYLFISIFEKFKFVILMCDYPISLFVMNTIISIIILAIQFFVMGAIII
ncbi:hypothetical protein R4I97_08060 [Brachyspira pilosicoli]|uniref:hypothetical protein n=1 Tax=Brachyspira pilosicoli TaxID=52584 RepID=UPI003006EBF3